MLPGIADITLCADVQGIIYDYQTRIMYPNASAIGNAQAYIPPIMLASIDTLFLPLASSGF